ncbi:MAG: GerMN domain-containing protein [Firmicutes bacterium]|nr:GerMN domain-containing protein [Bacillota bacterium]
MFLKIKRNGFTGIALTCFLLFFILTVAGFCLAGCGKQLSLPPETKTPANSSEEAENELGGPETEEPHAVVLYFADKQAACLVKEERAITEEDKDPRIFALEALIEGPVNSGLERTIPADAKVLDISVERGIAQVNFSRELQTSHWGGSTGEILTVYSIVNTLSQFPEIEQVKIIIEGAEIESLAGHMELDKPLEPDFGLLSP